MKRRRFDDAPDVLSPSETGELLGLSRNGVYEAIRRRQIPSVKIGRRILVVKATLLEVLLQPTTSRSETDGDER